MPPPTPPFSVAPFLTQFDTQLGAEYTRLQLALPGQPTAAVQQRFAECALFPKFGWPLVGEGAAEALAHQDPALLHQVLTRFVACAHAAWGRADADGIHPGGYDHCSLVTTAVHAAPLGLGYLHAVFHATRKPSRTGYAPLKHAANLMLCLANPGWPHRPKVLPPAEAYALGRSASAADKAFVSVFLGLLAGDAAATSQALLAFDTGYLKSDWGRHKPLTRVPFLQGLVALADAWGPAPVAAATRTALFTPAETALWQQLGTVREAAGREVARFAPFAPPLDFLNDGARFLHPSPP